MSCMLDNKYFITTSVQLLPSASVFVFFKRLLDFWVLLQ